MATMAIEVTLFWQGARSLSRRWDASWSWWEGGEGPGRLSFHQRSTIQTNNIFKNAIFQLSSKISNPNLTYHSQLTTPWLSKQGDKVGKDQVVYSLIKDQQSKWTTLSTTQFTNNMIKGMGARASQPTNPRSQQKTKQKQKQKKQKQKNKTNKQSYHVNCWCMDTRAPQPTNPRSQQKTKKKETKTKQKQKSKTNKQSYHVNC